jgi:putative SOS response-associated peptidase YedK
MCNQYAPPRPERIAARFGTALPSEPYRPGIGPEVVVGQWALIADRATEARRSSTRIMTNNARSETVASKPNFRSPWQRGQRCLIPADTFLEPNWESGANVWWRFQRADGEPWALAGLWNRWTDPASGELLYSYTMLTLNADAHPLMRRMHKPDPKLPADQQDKRSVVAIEPADFDLWLGGPLEQALTLIRLTSVEQFLAGPAG